MLYPVYVHVGDDQYAHSFTIPDCHSNLKAAPPGWKYQRE